MAQNASDDKFYKGDTLIKAFAISATIMAIFTVWMILDDFGREWKKYQSQFFVLKKEMAQKQMEEANAAIDPAKLKETQDAVAAATAATEGKKVDLERLKKEQVKLKTARINKVDKYQAAKGIYDVRKYEWEAVWGHKIAHGAGGHGHEVEGDPKLAAAEQKALDKLKAEWDKVAILSDDANAAVAAEDAKTAEITALNAEKEKADKSLKALRFEVDRLQGVKESAEFTMTKLVRSAPVLDLASPVFKIQQIVLPTIRDDVFFAQVGKVDRCTTCHMGIDTPGFENAAQPFRTHPNLELILGSRSPHPIDKVGCTVCHEGRGSSVDFTRTAHTPRNEEQRKEWKKKYGWHEMHHVIEKMVPLQYVEGKCRVCHRQTEHVPQAQKLNKAVQLVRGAGCYGCHRLEGWDHIRKPAPSLKRIKGKINHDWMVKWIRNPKAFNDHARMPAAFHQGNTDSPEYTAYQEAEIFAIADYLMANAEEYKSEYKVGLGNAERGKELFKTIGCLGCHGMDDFPEGRSKFGRAPDLTTVGSKVDKDWLTQWLKNPKHYWAETTMPSLRLTDSEISDVSAYLLAKKNPEFDGLDAGKPDFEMQKKVLSLYLMRDPKMAPATKEKVHTFVEGLPQQEVVQRLGKAGVMRYGCYGCHEVKGMETIPGIGADLSEHGSKLVNKFDFGYLELERSVPAWLHQKFHATRSFDKGIVKEYLDLLRMPNYGFDEKERNDLVTFILGMTAQKIDPPAAKVLNARESQVEEGSRVIHKYNCQGCHMVEGMFKSLPEGHPGFEEHEKNKWNLEGRIMAYYAEDESQGPPPLYTEGARVRTDWAFRFLNEPSWKFRRALKVRMPSFHLPVDENNKLVTGWARQGGIEFPISDLTPPKMTPVAMEAGRTLFNKLQCGNCHTVGQMTLTQDELEGGSKGYAPDLSRAYGKLNRDWIVSLLKDPQKMIPGTRMPGFWPEGVSPAPELLGGDSQKQQEALADYVLWLGYQKGGGRPVTGPSSSPNVSVAPTGAPKETKYAQAR